ncbi:hypothetical protein M1146_07060 [Patescibacteria group bacterium]|nr:hypothetical protein [Patescibacteria group bacterium]
MTNIKFSEIIKLMEEIKNVPKPDSLPQAEPVIPKPEAIQPAQPQTRSNFKLLLIVFGLIIAAGLLFGGYYFTKSQESTKVAAVPTRMVLLSPTPDTMTSWTTYQVKKLNLEFKLPPTLSKLGSLGEELIPGEKGIKLCLNFPEKTGLIKKAYAGGATCISQNLGFGFGTTSTDYQAGRDGEFTDLQGFVLKESKYYAKFVSNKTMEIDSNLVKKAINKNGVDVLMINGKNYASGVNEGHPISGTPGRGWFGALINSNNLTYPGIALQIETDKVSTIEFEQILSTFKFTDQSQALDTSSWKTYMNTKYGYSVKYPQNYSVAETSQDYVRFFKGPNDPNLPRTETFVSIQLEKNSKGLSFDQLKKQAQNGLDYIKTPGGKILRTTEVMGAGTGGVGDPKVKAEFDQILSTFKLVDPKEAWLNYMKISVDIPASWDGKYDVEMLELDPSEDLKTGKLKNLNFVFLGKDEKHDLFSIHESPQADWEKMQQDPMFKGKKLEIKNNMVYYSTQSLDNPYTGEDGDKYQSMAGDINTILSSFKFIE